MKKNCLGIMFAKKLLYDSEEKKVCHFEKAITTPLSDFAPVIGKCVLQFHVHNDWTIATSSDCPAS